MFTQSSEVYLTELTPLPNTMPGTEDAETNQSLPALERPGHLGWVKESSHITAVTRPPEHHLLGRRQEEPHMGDPHTGDLTQETWASTYLLSSLA